MCIVVEKPQVRIREYKKLNLVITGDKVCSFYCLHSHMRERIYRLENKCAVLGAQFKTLIVQFGLWRVEKAGRGGVPISSFWPNAIFMLQSN